MNETGLVLGEGLPTRLSRGGGDAIMIKIMCHSVFKIPPA